MCGILAAFSRQQPIDQPTFERALKRLFHRGPDGSKTWYETDGRLALGHTRLSIIDLKGGDQPIANEGGSCRIVHNGEFYDFERIRRELQAKGHQFSTASDSEIALHLYEEYGTECLHQLRGEFAFVIADQRNNRIFAARDRFGINPLFYARIGDTLVLASEIKALLEMGVPARWDMASYYQALFVFQDLDRTLFDGVYQVPPGHFLLAGEGHVRVLPYWDMDYPLVVATGVSDEEYKARFAASLEESIQLRLRSDVPVASFLSGGLDSSAVVGLAMKHVPRLDTFTVCFDDAAYDEGHIARETAAHTGAVFHEVPLTQAHFADHLGDVVSHAEALGVNMHGVARYLHSRAVRDAGFKVALTGEGSDEILAGYGHSRQDLIRFGSGMGGPMPKDAPKQLASVHKLLGFVPSWLKKTAVDRSIFHAFLSPEYEAVIGKRDPYMLFLDQFDIERQMRGRSPMIQSMYLWARSILPNYILLTDRLEMAFSLETRLPFLDHHLFDVVRNLPEHLLINDMREKYILRETTKHVLTNAVYNRPKQPFTAPPATLSPGNPLYNLLQDTLRGDSLKQVPFFNQLAVVALLDALPRMSDSRRLAFDGPLMMILCTCFLQQSYDMGSR